MDIKMEDEKYYSHNDQYIYQISINKPPVIKIYDLGQYYEPFCLSTFRIGVCPLGQSYVVKHGKWTYRVDRIFCKAKGHTIQKNGYNFDGHCYVFIDITMGVPINKKPFAKKPSEIDKMIKENKLIIITSK